MNCTCCDMELLEHDYYGVGNPMRDGFEKTGDIFKCDNEDCDMYQESFYTDKQGNLYEGYPC